MEERVALVVMSLIAAHYLQGRPPWTLQQLTQTLRIAMHAIDTVLEALQQDGILRRARTIRVPICRHVISMHTSDVRRGS